MVNKIEKKESTNKYKLLLFYYVIVGIVIYLLALISWIGFLFIRVFYFISKSLYKKFNGIGKELLLIEESDNIEYARKYLNYIEKHIGKIRNTLIKDIVEFIERNNKKNEELTCKKENKKEIKKDIEKANEESISNMEDVFTEKIKEKEIVNTKDEEDNTEENDKKVEFID